MLGLSFPSPPAHLKTILVSSAHSFWSLVRKAEPVSLSMRILLNWLKMTPTYRFSNVKAHTTMNPKNLRIGAGRRRVNAGPVRPSGHA